MAKLQFYNTLSGTLETFIPLSDRKVKMYNCGPTVYAQQHIGNMRPYVFADVLRRTLEEWDYSVKQVINITDVGHLTSDSDTGEDKMEAGARKLGRTAQEIAHEYTEKFFTDLDLLGIDRSKILFPRATEYIGEQIALVKALEEKGYAYKTSDGIYFDTERFPGYGKLGHIDISGQKDGARVEENKEKKNPHDFALWKLSKPKEKRQQEWSSPWGKGFPGWHIECTAMIFKLLGRQIDIHTGGIDHIPVHHNNEIAQAESITGKQYVRYWMHNEYISIEGKKIAKSTGNTVYLYQIADRGLSPRALRYLYLTAHYRSPMNFTWEAVEGANAALKRLTRLFFEEFSKEKGDALPDERFMRDFYTAIADDLDTPRALARVWELVKDDSISAAAKYAALIAADRILGLGLEERKNIKLLNPFAKEKEQEKIVEIPTDVKTLLDERNTARSASDFEKADALRKQILEKGYEVKDTPEGSTLLAKQ